MTIYVVMCITDKDTPDGRKVNGDSVCARYTNKLQATIHCEKVTEAAKGVGLGSVYRYVVQEQTVHDTYEEYVKEKYGNEYAQFM